MVGANESFQGDTPSPNVSVVIPCYDAQATIASAIKSVLNQTFEDFEVIVVDDGSRDSSRGIVQTLAAHDKRIRFAAQVNSGPSAARNRGTNLARAPIVAFLDSDDLWTASHLARHVDALNARPGLGISFSPCEIIDAAGALTGERSRVWQGDLEPEDLLGGNPTSTCSALVVRRHVFTDIGLMRENMSFAEDQDWLFRVALSDWKIGSIGERTVRYRTSPGGLSSNSANMLKGWQTFINHAREFAPELVKGHIARATAQIHIYHARRAIQTGQPAHIARGHLAAAFSASPRTISARPVHFAALTGAALAPGFASQAIKMIRGFRHA